MQRFVFPLEKLLSLRCSQLSLEEAGLQGLYGERAAIEAACRDLQHSDRAAARDVLAGEGVSGAELNGLAQYHQHVRQRLAGLDARRKDCAARITAQRQRVLELDRARKLLERLKERKLEEWQYETNREIEGTAGELFLAGWQRRRRRG
jgi:flagellar export protein FliJ